MLSRILVTLVAAGSGSSVALATATSAQPTPSLSVDVAYTGDLWYNLNGGLRREGTYLDNLDVVLSYDAGRDLGLTGTTIGASLLYNNRNTLSENIVGDLQTVSNIDTDGSLRLYEAWIDQKIGIGALKVGLIDLNSEFDVNEIGALFVNSSHGIGPDFSQIGEIGPGIFPVTALGARLSINGGGSWELRGGVFEGRPGDPDHPRRTTLRLERGEGLLVVAEAIARPNAATRIALGSWHHDGAAETGLSDDWGIYAHIDSKIWSNEIHKPSGFARLGFASGDVYQVDRYKGAGIVLEGPLFGDGDQAVGLAIASATNADAYRRARLDEGGSADRSETIVEVTYRAALTPWLTLQPDLQYIIDPGTDPTLGNALVAGLRFEMRWGLKR